MASRTLETDKTAAVILSSSVLGATALDCTFLGKKLARFPGPPFCLELACGKRGFRSKRN